MKFIYLISSLVSICSSQVKINPGIKIKLDQESLNIAKVVSQRFLPNIVKFDLGLPKELTKYMFNENIKFQWKNIIYDKIDLNMNDVKIQLI